MNFLSYLINGISLGSVYAIIALGYTMVYGIAKMLNFAHGDVIMIGCYVVFLAMNGQGWPPLVAVVLSVIFSGCINDRTRSMVFMLSRDQHERSLAETNWSRNIYLR